VNAWSAQRVWLRLPQDFSSDRRGIPFAEGEELQQVHEGVPFCPSEVGMRDHAGLVAAVQQRRRDRVRNRRADAPEHMVSPDIDACYIECQRELGDVAWAHFDEQHALLRQEMMRILGLAQLPLIYSSGSPLSGLLAMIRTGDPAASLMKRSAISSVWTPRMRSSVERATREMSDVAMIVTINHDAIFTPSGRSMMFVTVV
jgi:hypothetical protein